MFTTRSGVCGVACLLCLLGRSLVGVELWTGGICPVVVGLGRLLMLIDSALNLFSVGSVRSKHIVL